MRVLIVIKLKLFRVNTNGHATKTKVGASILQILIYALWREE
jgi:hypothetical protein